VARLRIQGMLSGVEVVQTMWQVVVLRDDKAVWWGSFEPRPKPSKLSACRSKTLTPMPPEPPITRKAIALLGGFRPRVLFTSAVSDHQVTSGFLSSPAASQYFG
jgi:hypothetical protein